MNISIFDLIWRYQAQIKFLAGKSERGEERRPAEKYGREAIVTK